MKNFKTVLAILAISIASVLPTSANTNTEPTSNEAKTVLRAEIVNLLGNHKYDLKNKTLEAQVSIMLNNQNELVVVAVNSNNERVAGYVKARLNYKKIDVKGIQKGTVYRLHLKMTPTS
jgi:uncharacterized protein YdeI (BOF family)